MTENKHQLPGQLVTLTYDGLPVEHSRDDIYVVGEIPVELWDVIRDRHEEYMRDNPGDWTGDDLFDITIEYLRYKGFAVFTFSDFIEFPAMRNVLCDWCKCIVPSGIVQYKEAMFCTESCLFEALTQRAGEISIRHRHFICPHCNEAFLPEAWEEGEGPYTVSGPDGFSFTVMTCPECGGVAPLIVYVTVSASSKILRRLPTRIRQQEKFSPAPENPKLCKHTGLERLPSGNGLTLSSCCHENSDENCHALCEIENQTACHDYEREDNHD